MKTRLVTYLYEGAIKYIPEFIETIKKQTNQKFTLVVFNDGIQHVEKYFNLFEGKIEIIDVKGTPTEIRFHSFTYLCKTDADYIIFQDVDDGMSANRIDVVSNLLNKYNIVSNDLTLMNDHGKIYNESIWSKRLNDRFIFNYKFIEQYNIVGIGNSGVRKKILEIPIKYSKLPKVGDWFIFYQFLYLSQSSAIFTTKCQTFYRQHENNMAGIKKIDKARLEYVINVKKSHFLGLTEIGFDFHKEMKELDNLEKSLEKINNINSTIDNLFWWEETNHLIIN